MQLTPEQQTIIQSAGNIKINAVAGSGKTTTIIEYARTRPPGSKILYLAFNRSVKREAQKKFADIGLKNVKVETAHSLAYKNIVFKNGYKVRSNSYRTYELVEILGIKGSGEKHFEYILANHVNKFVTYFCNSNVKKVQEMDYLQTVSDKKAKTFVKNSYRQIERQTRILLAKMDKGEIDVTHDFYLKKFQLSGPQLHFDYILFDEGQDASPAMLDVFLNQKVAKVIVGDTHQQIYGWRHAVNSLEKVQYPVNHLTNSFRLNPDVSRLASEILEWKRYLQVHETVKITGIADYDKVHSKAVLARTNLGLLYKAIEYTTVKKKVQHIYFEGNINSYTYADDGASLYDILHLYNGDHQLIKDKLVRSMRDIEDLEEYIKKTDDVQLTMMVEIVKEYGNRIPGIIKTIKEKHLPDDEKHKAEMIFSTVHRCKGMEYDAVQLADDFITEEKIKKSAEQKNEEELDKAKMIEEINLLYVAITRTKNHLFIPENLMPLDFPMSKHIHIEKKVKEEEHRPPPVKKEFIIPKEKVKHPEKILVEKAYSVKKIREKHASAYLPWTEEEDDELTLMFCNEKSVKEMMQQFGRSHGAINSRIKKLELLEKYG